jgi:hypothetical protein|tara:strand:- start:2946 stop:3242 length:297 start_codon:yes stop_codon:yes gene_type:complete
MSTIISIGINKEKIQFNDKGWANISVFVNDETNVYGQNVSAAMDQTKDQRDAKEPKQYIANGKVVWTDGKITVADKVEQQTGASEQSEAGRATPDLPF